MINNEFFWKANIRGIWLAAMIFFKKMRNDVLFHLLQ